MPAHSRQTMFHHKYRRDFLECVLRTPFIDEHIHGFIWFDSDSQIPQNTWRPIRVRELKKMLILLNTHHFPSRLPHRNKRQILCGTVPKACQCVQTLIVIGDYSLGGPPLFGPPMVCGNQIDFNCFLAEPFWIVSSIRRVHFKLKCFSNINGIQNGDSVWRLSRWISVRPESWKNTTRFNSCWIFSHFCSNVSTIPQLI